MKRSVIISLAILLFSSLANAPLSAAKPLTTIQYTEFCTQNNLCIPQVIPEKGLKVGGVTYRASPADPSDVSAYALYGDPAFLLDGGIPAEGLDRLLENPVLSGTGAMTLTLVFDKPTNVVNFAVAVPKSKPKGVVLVTLYGPGVPGKIVFPQEEDKQAWPIEPNVPGVNDAFLGTQFVYKKAAVKYAVLVFSQPFALDNLQFHVSAAPVVEPPMVEPPVVEPEPSAEGSTATASVRFSDPGVVDAPFSCMVNYGDKTDEQAGVVAGDTCTGPAHLYADNGVYAVTVSVTDNDNETGRNEAPHTVINQAPSVGPIQITPAPPVVAVHTAIQATAAFNDPGIRDTHTAVWAWGDGSPSAGTIHEANGAGTVSGEHVYLAPGVYTVQVTVTDKDGATGESLYQFIVAYNPSGGFVTGAGMIDSPPDAYAPNPSLTGKAHFGFVLKYEKGAAVPTGTTQFRFHLADLRFESTSYDWLVVNQAASNVQLKGSGAINGLSDPNGSAYRFMLWAGDGTGLDGADTFRIRIWWETDGGEVVVYDNRTAQPIQGGNIVVHKEAKAVGLEGEDGERHPLFVPLLSR